jgi:integrase/recombinase XerD
MPAALVLDAEHDDTVAEYLTAMRVAGRKTGHSTVQAARSFCAKLQRAGGWEHLSSSAQLDAIRKARSFASWLMVTGQIAVGADLFTRLDLRLGNAARTFSPEAHAWFVESCERLRVRPHDIGLQWNALVKVAATTGVAPDQVGDGEFELARTALVDAYVARGMPASGRNMAAIFHRLRLTLFHVGRLDTYRHPSRHPPVSVTGWATVAPALADTGRRYVAQVRLSLRPSTVKAIDRDLREFGTWLSSHYPEVASCADLERHHIEAYKAWLATEPRCQTGGKPLSRVSIKNALINLHCFFDRITEWGYPHPPPRPLVFAGDLPIIDKPLPRFLDDGAAAKLLRTARQDTDPLARLVTELLARTGIRRGELLGLTVDAVVQIGSAYWLRIRAPLATPTSRPTRWSPPARTCTGWRRARPAECRTTCAARWRSTAAAWPTRTRS